MSDIRNDAQRVQLLDSLSSALRQSRPVLLKATTTPRIVVGVRDLKSTNAVLVEVGQPAEIAANDFAASLYLKEHGGLRCLMRPNDFAPLQRMVRLARFVASLTFKERARQQATRVRNRLLARVKSSPVLDRSVAGRNGKTCGDIHQEGR